MTKKVLGIALLIACSSVMAKDGCQLGQPSFHICARPVSGVSYKVRTGLDADSIVAKSKYGEVQILIGRPSAFFDSAYIFISPPGRPDLIPGDKIAVPETLTSDLQLIGRSLATKAILYGYSRGTIKINVGTEQDKVLVLLTAKGGQSSSELLRRVGSALYRCP